MIKSLRLINFKGFDRHTVEFQPFSVVVGHNNAGKSSAFEALRIVATVAKKLLTHKFVDSPDWAYGCGMGISPKLDEINLKRETIFYKYSEPPATIKATFENGAQIFVHLGPDEKIHAQAITPDGRDVKTKTLARNCEFPPIFILPQISPLLETETALRKSYVQKCIDTQLSSRHFRNQIRYMYEHFDDFRNLFQQTWDSISIAEFDDPNAYYEDELFLMLREQGFVAEVSNFGHGLQMWLQIVWFLARTDSQSIVILDEPDVYMHPQQQQRMIELLRGRFKQCILSTHAPGILHHCHEEEILRLHRKLEKSSCELDNNTYEELLQEESKLPSLIEKNNQKLIEVKSVVYQSGSLKITGSNGVNFVEVAAKQSPNKILGSSNEADVEPEDLGIEGTFLVEPDQKLYFEIGHPDDVNVYFDGTPLIVNDSTGTASFSFQTSAESVIEGKEPFFEHEVAKEQTQSTGGDNDRAEFEVGEDEVQLRVSLGNYAAVRITNMNNAVILYVNSGKQRKSEYVTVIRQKICFEIANANEVSFFVDGDEVDADRFREGDTAYFELDLDTMEMNS